jgi:hypothetical protein
MKTRSQTAGPAGDGTNSDSGKTAGGCRTRDEVHVRRTPNSIAPPAAVPAAESSPTPQTPPPDQSPFHPAILPICISPLFPAQPRRGVQLGKSLLGTRLQSARLAAFPPCRRAPHQLSQIRKWVDDRSRDASICPVSTWRPLRLRVGETLHGPAREILMQRLGCTHCHPENGPSSGGIPGHVLPLLALVLPVAVKQASGMPSRGSRRRPGRAGR